MRLSQCLKGQATTVLQGVQGTKGAKVKAALRDKNKEHLSKLNLKNPFSSGYKTFKYVNISLCL